VTNFIAPDGATLTGPTTEGQISEAVNMDPYYAAVERACQLAKSGLCTSVDEIWATLREGYRPDRLRGQDLATQLMASMRGGPKTW
jgi:hypothetical protein